jgi:hypothetical protein
MAGRRTPSPEASLRKVRPTPPNPHRGLGTWGHVHTSRTARGRRLHRSGNLRGSRQGRLHLVDELHGEVAKYVVRLLVVVPGGIGGLRLAAFARPPLRPASRASARVHSCARPCSCTALPPLDEISRCSSGSMPLKPLVPTRSDSTSAVGARQPKHEPNLPTAPLPRKAKGSSMLIRLTPESVRVPFLDSRKCSGEAACGGSAEVRAPCEAGNEGREARTGDALCVNQISMGEANRREGRFLLPCSSSR